VILRRPDLLPPGVSSEVGGPRDRTYLAPGMPTAVRVTTDPELRARIQSMLDKFPAEAPNRTDINPRALNTNAPQFIDNDILGTELIQEDPHTGQRNMRFLPGPIFAQLILADEINRTPPKTQAAMLEAMAELQVSIAGATRPLRQPFLVVATQNPIEQEGTYPLPEAQLDRFMFSLWMDYPTREEEVEIVAQTPRIRHEQVEQVFDEQSLTRCIELIWRMPASRHVVDYAVSLARATRPDDNEAPKFVKNFVSWGAGPRAGQYLIHAAKALAAIEGDPAPGCGHVRRAAMAVLRHRILINYAASGEGVSAADVVNGVVDHVREPSYA